MFALELLQHDEFLRRIARGLAGADGEDLAQDVWERALARPPERRGHVRAWLARVARNLALNRVRGRGRREEREQEVAGAAEVAAPTAEEVEVRFELRRNLVQALDELPEPFRGTLILRYFEGLALADIAARHAVPVATVKSRLARGIARMRTALDLRYGDRRAWLLGLGTLVPSGAQVAAATALTASGGILVWTTAKLAMVIVALGAALWIANRGESGGAVQSSEVLVSDPGSSSAPAPPESASDEQVVDSSEPLGGRTAVRTAAAESPALPAPERFTAMGRILGAKTIDCGEVHIAVAGLRHDGGPEMETRVEGLGRTDGSYELDVGNLFDPRSSEPAIEELLLRFDHPRYCPAELRVRVASGRKDGAGRTTFRADVPLVEASVVKGRILAPNGRPAALGVACAFHVLDGSPVTPAVDAASCRDDGSFALRVNPTQNLLLALLDDRSRPTTLAIELANARDHDVGDVQLRAGARISGSVRRNGATLAGARVELQPEESGSTCSVLLPSRPISLIWRDSRFERGRSACTSDGVGDFAFDGLVPAAYTLSVVRGAGVRSSLVGPRAVLDVRAPAEGAVLDYGWATLRFELVGERGPGAGRLVLESRYDRADVELAAGEVEEVAVTMRRL